MTRPTRIIAGVLGTLVFLLILAVIVVKIVFTKDRILSILQPQMERVIDRPVSIADAGVTLWGGIGVRLDGLIIGNPPGFTQEPMLNISSLEIKAQFWPLLTGRVVIDRILLLDPYLLIESNTSGQSNYDGLFKSDPPPDSMVTSDSRERVSVAKVLVEGARVAWRDQREARWVDLHGADVILEVNAASWEHPKFTADVVFDSLLFFQHARRLSVRAGNPSVHLDGLWNKPNRTLILDSILAEWWGAKLSAAGQVRFLPSLYEVSVNARLGSIRIEELIREMQSAFPLDKFKDLTAGMTGSFEARFVWPLPQNKIPEWQGRFEVVDLNWPLPQTDAIVTIPRMEVRGSDRSVSWSASAGAITGGTFSTSGTIDQMFLEEQTFSARLQADIPLEGTQGLLPEEWRSSVEGAVDLDLTAFGTAGRWRDAHVTGRIHSERLMISDDDWDFDSLSLAIDCRLTGQGLQISRCDVVAGDSRGSITGRIEKIIPSMLSNFTLPDVPHGQVEAVCQFLNLDRIIGDEKTTAAGSSSVTGSDIPLLAITGTLTCDTLIYNQMTIHAAKSPYIFRDRVVSLSAITGELYGGTISGRLDWNLNTWPEPEFFTSISADGIEANDFFARYFDWAGGILGRMAISGEFSGRGRIAARILPTLIAQGQIDLSSTRLESAPLLAQVGRSLGVAGLDRVRSLRELRLPFRVESGRVVTNDLRVTWDDVSYVARGSFGLDQTLAYQVTAISQGDRAPRIFQGVGSKFRVSGTLTSPTVTVDAAGTAQDILDRTVDAAKDTIRKTLDEKLKDILNPSGKP